MDQKTFRQILRRARPHVSQTTGSYKALTYLLLFGLAVTVPLVLLFGALLLHSASVQRVQMESRVSQVRDALVSDLDREFDRDITILHTLATSKAFADEDWPAFYNQAKAGLQGRAYLVLIDAKGQQLVNTYVPYGKQPALTGDPETLRRILETRTPVVSNLFTSLVVKKPVFNISIPIVQDNKVRYVMSLGLLPDDVSALLNAQKLGPEWVTLIWDSNGVLLARSQESSRFVGKRLPQNMREQDQRAVVRTTNLDGVDVLHATARSQLSGWGVGVNVPYSLATEQMRNSLLLWGVAGLLAITIALVAGVFFARQLTTSLSIAADAAAAFGRGEAFPLTGSRLTEADAFLVTLKDAQQAREKLTDEVKRSRDWLQTTLVSIGDAVIATDADGKITLMNLLAEELTGWTLQQALGKPLAEVFQIVNEQTRQTVENPVDKVRRLNKVVGLANHTILISKSGRDIAIDDSGAPIFGPEGALAGIVLVFRDVTHQRQLEAALQSNERLALAGRLSASIAHEINNPIDAVSNALYLINKRLEGQHEVGPLISLAQTETHRVAEITKNMLSLYRESRAASSVKLSELLEGVVALIEETIVKGHRKIEVVRPGFSGEIEAFPSELRQVFTNVLKNAVEATADDGEIRVYSESAHESGHDGVLVRVVDAGVGIPEELQPRLFDPFVTTKEESGTGLGLWVSRNILEKHGGSIRLSSGTGLGNRGTTVSIFLPLKIAARKSADRQTSARSEAAS